MKLERSLAHVEVALDADAVAESAAVKLADLARSAILDRGRYTIALAGGSTPRRAHERIAGLPSGAVSWTDVHVFFSDERVVPSTHPHSNYRMAHETLLSRIDIPSAQVHRYPVELGVPSQVAAAYASTLAEIAGPQGILDLVFLGLGTDGHTASLFEDDRTVLGEPLIIGTEAPAGSPSRPRVTFSYTALARARQVIVLVAGEEKAQVLAAVLDEQRDVPLTRMLRLRGGNTIILTDQAAARLLGGHPEELSP